MRSSSLRAMSLCALALVSLAHQSALAQSCVESTGEHWSFDSRWYYETFDYFCGPAQGNAALAAYCAQAMAVSFVRTPPAASASTQAIVGMTLTGMHVISGGRVVYSRLATIPAACVFPVGGTPESDGKLHLIHSPRYNAADPDVTHHVSERRLHGDTSMCFGDGDDRITLNQRLFSYCGPHQMVPFDYYGHWFLAYGEGGRDQLTGAVGREWLFGGTGDDVLNGRGGGDMISGDSNKDILYGDLGDDVLMGGSGNDFLIDSSGSLDIHTGSGGDDCFSDLASLSIAGSDGTDIAGSDTRAGALSISSVEASSGWCIPH